MSPPKFFQHDEYVIDRPPAAFCQAKAFRVFSTSGEQIGDLHQEMPAGQTNLSLSPIERRHRFICRLTDASGTLLAQVARGGPACSSLAVLNSCGDQIAEVRRRLTTGWPTFAILATGGTPIADILGDRPHQRFTIVAATGHLLGWINRRPVHPDYSTNDPAHPAPQHSVPQPTPTTRCLLTFRSALAESREKVAIVVAVIGLNMIMRAARPAI